MEMQMNGEPERKVFFQVYKIDGDWAYLFRGDNFYKKKMTLDESQRWHIGIELNLYLSELSLVY